MKNYKLAIITIICILFIVYICMCIMCGFPWERFKASTAVEEYVAETYNLTPVKIQTHFSFDANSGATVYTKELPFSFEVAVNKSGYVSNDSYFTSFVEYYIEKQFSTKLKTLLNENFQSIVTLETPLTARSPKGLTIEQLNEDPDIVFDCSEITYYCTIKFYKKGWTKDKLNSISDKIFQNYQPTFITFYYPNNFGKEVSYTVYR